MFKTSQRIAVWHARMPQDNQYTHHTINSRPFKAVNKMLVGGVFVAESLSIWPLVVLLLQSGIAAVFGVLRMGIGLWVALSEH